MSHRRIGLGARAHGARLIGLTILFITTAGSPARQQGEDKAWRIPERKASVANPVAVTPDSVRLGRAIYQRECFSCHGQSGLGDGPGAADLEAGKARFTAGRLEAQSDGALFYKITMGREPMPGFRELLGEEERWNVVNHLRAMLAAGVQPRYSAPLPLREGLSGLLHAYSDLHEALASRNVDSMKPASEKLAREVEALAQRANEGLEAEAGTAWKQMNDSLVVVSQRLAQADDDAARLREFSAVSRELVNLLVAFGHSDPHPPGLFQSSVAGAAYEAIWLQVGGPARDPYAPESSEQAVFLHRIAAAKDSEL